MNACRRNPKGTPPMAKPDFLERMTILKGDITKLEVDAIVNAAIHAAAGPALLDECRTLGGCPTGEARITRGYLLPARHVIHAVGPIWQGGGEEEEGLLEGCYRNSLKRARENNLASIAFPAISTGVYRFPPERATEIAVATVAGFLSSDGSVERVVFCSFGEASRDAHQRALSQLG